MTATAARPEAAPAPPPVQRPAGSVRAPSRRTGPEVWFDRVALVLLGLAASVLSVWNLTGATPYQDDEGTYTAQAFSVLEGNLTPYTYWYDHPPLGWIQAAGLAWIPQLLGLGDGTYIGATRYVIAPFFVATALLVYLIVRRMGVRGPIAAFATVTFVLSPITLVIGRQIYLDNIGIPWLLLAFYLALSPRSALWHHIGAGVFFAIAVLSKETLALFGPALMVALLNRPAWSNRTFSVVGFLVTGGLVLGFYPLIAALRGELFSGPGHVSLQDALAFQFLDRSGSGSVWEEGSSRSVLVQGWLYYDTYIVAAGLLAAVLCLLRRRSVWIPVALGSAALPVVLGQGYLPSMYVIGVVPFLAVALGVGLDVLWSGFEKAVSPLRPRARSITRRTAAVAVALTLVTVSLPHWWEQNRVLLTQDANTDWTSTLEWVQDNVPREDTVLAPYSMWQDLITTGWQDSWSMIVTEKADLDEEFRRKHPEGVAAIEWVVVGPYTQSNIDSLGLKTVAEALEHSVAVQTFGGWSVHRVQAGWTAASQH